MIHVIQNFRQERKLISLTYLNLALLIQTGSFQEVTMSDFC